MAPPRIGVLTMILALLGAATLSAVIAPAAAQSAASSVPVAVSISARRVLTMPTSTQPGISTFQVTSAAKGGSFFQLMLPAATYTAAEAARDIEAIDAGKLKQLRRFEANVTLAGGMQADETTDTLVAPLEPGTYWALDFNTNNPDKFFVFTVTGAESGNAMPAVSETIKAKKATKWANSPTSIPHKGLLNFENASSNNHFVALIKLKKGKTYSDFTNWFKAALAGEPAGPEPLNDNISLDSGVVSPGRSAAFNYRLPKGHYVLLCFWPDASMDGMPHAFMGMHRPITLR